MNHTTVEVKSLPLCDMCAQNGIKTKAGYDARTVFGPWGNLCQGCFEEFGVGLGLGLGQELVLDSIK